MVGRLTRRQAAWQLAGAVILGFSAGLVLTGAVFVVRWLTP